MFKYFLSSTPSFRERGPGWVMWPVWSLRSSREPNLLLPSLGTAPRWDTWQRASWDTSSQSITPPTTRATSGGSWTLPTNSPSGRPPSSWVRSLRWSTQSTCFPNWTTVQTACLWTALSRGSNAVCPCQSSSSTSTAFFTGVSGEEMTLSTPFWCTFRSYRWVLGVTIYMHIHVNQEVPCNPGAE